MKNRQIMKLLVLLLFFAAMNCVQAYAVYQSTPPTTIWMIAPEISLDINTVNVTAGDALGFNISLYNPNEYVTVGNMSIKIGRRTESGPYEYLAENIITTDSALEFEANSTRILEYNWSSVGSAEGIYKVYAKFNYNGTYTTRYKTFNVVISGENDTGEDNETDSGDDSGGEEALETISIKGSLDFGSISTIGIRYDSGDMEYGKLRIIGYVSGPKKISQDLYEKTIYKDFCNTNTGVEIRNVHRHSRFYLNIPLIIKDNCDSKYDAGEYEITVRACNYVEGVWTYHKDSILKKKMNIQINENENDDCATASEINECEKCDYEAIFCRNGGLDSSLGKNAPETEKRHIYEIPEFDETVYIGDVFRTKITVFNNSSKNESGTVYSYAYDNATLISDGLNGSVWSHNWNANKVVFEIKPYSNKTFSLENKIDNCNAGLYKLKARLYFGGKKYDIIRRIAVLEHFPAERISFECNASENLATVNIRNLDSAEINMKIYALGDNRWESEEIVVKKKSEKKIEFYMGSSDVLILGIDNKRDLHKCYISAGENGSDEDSCVDNDVNDITGRFLAESNNGENWGKKGFFAWILGLLGF